MSNGKEMVSITRETAKQAAHLLAAHSTGPSLERDTAEELRAALDKPAKRHQGEPVAWLTKCKPSGLVEQAEPNEKASNPEQWTDAFPVYDSPKTARSQFDYDRGFAVGTAECETLRAQLAERDALLERALRLLTPNVSRFRGSVGWAVEVDRFVADLSASAPVGDGVHDDTEAVRAALERKP